MAEEAVSTETAAQDVATNTAEDQASETQDWQAKYEDMRRHSREWEKRAKENAAAADELEQLKQAQLTEQEKDTARAEKAESELAAMKAEQELFETRRSVADQTGAPLELMECCTDKEAMERAAQIYLAKQPPVHAAGKAKASQVVTGGEGALSNGDLFAQAAEMFLK